jgi:hypothetical protein
MHRVEVKVNLAGRGTVLLDGEDVSDMVAGVQLACHVGDANEVTLELPAEVWAEVELEALHVARATEGPLAKVMRQQLQEQGEGDDA